MIYFISSILITGLSFYHEYNIRSSFYKCNIEQKEDYKKYDIKTFNICYEKMENIFNSEKFKNIIYLFSPEYELNEQILNKYKNYDTIKNTLHSLFFIMYTFYTYFNDIDKVLYDSSNKEIIKLII